MVAPRSAGDIIMRKLVLVLNIVMAFPINLAFAQQPQMPKPEISGETRRMCRDAALKICSTGLIPNRDEIRRCAFENKEKLPAQCQALMAAREQEPRH
jgi:hypothetical protein